MLHAALFVGDDWAEDHHDVELVDEAGVVLARKRLAEGLAEGLAGVTGLHALIGEHLPDPGDDLDPHPQMIVGIETGRGPWVASLIAAGYTVRVQVYALNPCRWRGIGNGTRPRVRNRMPRMRTCWPTLAEILRLDRAAHRPVAGDTALAEGIKVAARSHQNLVWERTRHVLRLRSALREFYPAAPGCTPGVSRPGCTRCVGAAGVVGQSTRSRHRCPTLTPDH